MNRINLLPRLSSLKLPIRTFTTTTLISDSSKLPKSFISPSSSSTTSTKAPRNPSPFYRPEPPLVAAARAKSVKQRNVFESYLVLDPKIRLYFSLGLMVFAVIGLYAGDKIVPLTDEEKEIKELSS